MTSFPDPPFLILILVVIGLVPFIAVIATAYVKIVVVMQLLRNALGIQQIPPTMTMQGLAIILTIYIMAPIGLQSFQILAQRDLATLKGPELVATLGTAAEPFRGFLARFAAPRHRAFFLETAHKLWPPEATKDLDDKHFLILLPAFTVSELTNAFEIGFLLYLPFIAIDLVISNILMAMGMMMVSPMTISLPFKLLLFVMLDGWTRLLQGLVLSYVP